MLGHQCWPVFECVSHLMLDFIHLTLMKFPIKFCSKLRQSLVNGLYQPNNESHLAGLVKPSWTVTLVWTSCIPNLLQNHMHMLRQKYSQFILLIHVEAEQLHHNFRHRLVSNCPISFVQHHCFRSQLLCSCLTRLKFTIC